MTLKEEIGIKEDSVKIYRADKNCLKIIQAAVVIAVIAVIFLCKYFLSFIPQLMLALNILFIIAGFFIAAIYLPVYFRNLGYYIDKKNNLVKTSGFFFIKKQVMSIDSIQYKTLVSTPFSKLTGLNFSLFYAYGGMMTVMFLKRNDFDELCFRMRG